MALIDDDQIEPQATGITNSAPEGTIPVTTDGDGNLGDSNITYDGVGLLQFTVDPNGGLQLHVVGAGAQLQLAAADGDATHVGGEASVTTGNSDGQSGGLLTLSAGFDTGGGDGGGVVIQSGKATFAGEGGDAGEINIKGGGGEVSDGKGGNINIVGGPSLDGQGGRVTIQAGTSTNGDKGIVEILSPTGEGFGAIIVGDTGIRIDIEPVAGTLGFFNSAGVARPQVPASPNAQDIVDALVALGLITQAA